jgi:predicted thioesterase
MESEIFYEVSAAVTRENTALAMESGDLPVLATPAVGADGKGGDALRGPGFKGGGDHCRKRRLGLFIPPPPPVGAAVRVRAALTGREGRRLQFSLTAWDGAGEIGRGTHERVVVEAERFLRRAKERNQ